METIHVGCHNNQISYSTRKKITIYLEANVPGMYAKFQLQLLYGLCEIFKNLPFISPRQPIRLMDFGKRRMKHGGLLNQRTCICEKSSNISNETAETVNFYFSHYKSMGTISCHSNQSYATELKKNTLYVEANVINMYAKYQLYPPNGF